MSPMSRRVHARVVAMVVSACGVFGGSALIGAEIPHLIRYQGQAVDSQGVPLEGPYALTFRLYDAEMVGTKVWEEAQTNVPLQGGHFSVLLGQVTPLTTMDWSQPRWLSVQVGSDPELAPRQRITSVPLAIRAETAERLDETPKFQLDTGGTLPIDLVAYWKLNELSGPRADTKGPHTLADNNTVTQATGKAGNAAQFTAANSEYLSVADNTDLSTGDIDFSIAGWFSLDSQPGGYGVVGKTGATNREYLVAGGGGFPIRWLVQDSGGSNHFVDWSSNPSTGQWYFFVGWHDSVNNEIGIQIDNGTPVTLSYSGGVRDGTNAFELGRYEATPGTSFDGRIDEVGFWKKVLTSQERADLYNNGAGNTYVDPNNSIRVSNPDISARVYNSASLSTPHNSEAVLTFDLERWDTDSIHDTVSNTSRLTAKTSGNYLIFGHVVWAGTGGGSRRVMIRQNGVTDIASESRISAGSDDGRQTIVTFYSLSAGDYVELVVFQSSGQLLAVLAERNDSPEFGMVKLP